MAGVGKVGTVVILEGNELSGHWYRDVLIIFRGVYLNGGGNEGSN